MFEWLKSDIAHIKEKVDEDSTRNKAMCELLRVQNERINELESKLDAALDAAHDMGLEERFQAGLNNIMNYTGKVNKGDE